MILLHRITAYLLLIAAIIISFFLINPVEKQASDSPDIDSPSPALGRAVATGIHQVVTDPYLVPIENLSEYLAANPDRQEISVDLLTKWASDLQFPTCFVWDAVRGGMQIDHPSSPWAMEAIVEQLDEGLITDNPRGQLFISVFKVEGEKYWLGYLPVPGGFSRVRQMAGVFFSIDKYLERDVPRLINEMVSRSRFPLVPFQRDMEPIYGENDGHISFRILKKDGSVFLQRGRNFDLEKVIYSESRWYKNPIVCLQTGWDLQVFSSNVEPEVDAKANDSVFRAIILTITLIIATALFWWGVAATGKKITTED